MNMPDLKIMKPPGFTAEATLYRTSKFYWPSVSFAEANWAIHPAQQTGGRDPGCVSDCLDKCADRGSFTQACFNHCVKGCPFLVEEPPF